MASSFIASTLPIPTSLGGLSLQFGPVLTPMFFAAGGQVNAQVPWELAGQTQTTLTAAINGQTSALQTVAIAPYAPGIFSMDGSGTGQGAILDSSYHLVSAANPASAGTYIQIYCTGLGPVTNQPATGSPAPSNPASETSTLPTVTFGGVAAKVAFAGLTPGTVGLYQVNVQVPGFARRGSAVNVALSIGGVPSNIVTIAIQ